MPPQNQGRTQTQFINEIRSGDTVQQRTQTLCNGWLEQLAPLAKDNAPLQQWITAQQSQVQAYTTAVAGSTMGAGGKHGG